MKFIKGDNIQIGCDIFHIVGVKTVKQDSVLISEQYILSGLIDDEWLFMDVSKADEQAIRV